MNADNTQNIPPAVAERLPFIRGLVQGRVNQRHVLIYNAKQASLLDEFLGTVLSVDIIAKLIAEVEQAQTPEEKSQPEVIVRFHFLRHLRDRVLPRIDAGIDLYEREVFSWN